MDKILQDLIFYACLEGSEIGELCGVLELIYRFRSYYLSNNFEKAIENEIKAQLLNFKEHTNIIEEKITTERNTKELEWF